MCGIVGFIGKQQAAPVLLDGLSKLEYRGYDSAGIAIRKADGNIEVSKAKGRLNILAEQVDGGKAVEGVCGIGHTRWATHGEPSSENAHPHFSNDESVVGVHNGIIENYQELKEMLSKKGYKFVSQTDTEVVIMLLDYYYKKKGLESLQALQKTINRVRGSYALAVMFKDKPNEIYAVKKDSPMILGVENDEVFLASDVPAILKYARNVYYIDDLEIACLRQGEVIVYNEDLEIIEKELVHIDWDVTAAEKGGYEHFMMKEIHEQSRAIKDTMASVIVDNKIDYSIVGITEEELKNIKQIHIVACGSSYHVGIAAQYVIEDLTRVPVRVELASEFRYRNPILGSEDLVIVISQSGETADTLAALREAKKQGVKTFAMVNVIGSSIAREADYTFYTLAGPEIAVATTKAYSAQLIACNLLALHMASVKGMITQERCTELLVELQTLPEKMESILEDKERIQRFAAEHANAKDVFFIGRGIDYAIGLEGSLKMKEISYIHSEAYAAGELKHGTISLIEDGILVISLLTQEALYEKLVSNMIEVKSRGAYIMGLTNEGYTGIDDSSDFTVFIPKTESYFTSTLAAVPLQLMGYYISVARGLDVDKPRNLAKSVTVE